MLGDDDPFADAREQMVRSQIAGRGVRDRRVLEAMRTVPRHLFVPEELVWFAGDELPPEALPQEQHGLLSGASSLRGKAYADRALPIGWGQTISQPYMVAYMTECLRPQSTDIVLEIGTGCGYQTAILSLLVEWVYTIEIVEPLARRAKALLDALDVRNVSAKVGDGHEGWPEHGPFDAIIVTCAPESPPQGLIDQLREGGRMVVPTGRTYAPQTLRLLTRRRGEVQEEALLPVAFVPMVGGHGDKT